MQIIRSKSFFLMFSGSVFLFAADRVLKVLMTGANMEIIPGLLEITYERNTGIAFGLPVPVGISLILSLLLVAAGLFFVWKYFDPAKKAGIIAVALLLGGALGNIYDRFVHGYVIDYVSVWKWPVFNLADAAILIGAVTIALKFDSILANKTKN